MTTQNKWIDGKASSSSQKDAFKWAINAPSNEKQEEERLPDGVANAVRITVKSIQINGKPASLDGEVQVNLKVELKGAGCNIGLSKYNGYLVNMDVVDFE